jgi:hypothetical protein
LVTPPKKPRKPTVKKDASGADVVTPEKAERGKGRPRKVRPLETGEPAATAMAAATAVANALGTMTPLSVGGGLSLSVPASAPSRPRGQPKNVTSVTARRKLEKEENAPFPWKPNSVKPVRMDPRTGAIAIADPGAPCPPGFVDCWPCPEQGCNERHATDRQLATHVRLVHDDGKWRCPFYPSQCNKTYKLAHHVALHYSGVHEGVKHHTCPWEGCNLNFLNRGGLMQHYNFIHLKRNTDAAAARAASANGSPAPLKAPKRKRARGRSVDDSAVALTSGGGGAASASGDQDDGSSAATAAATASAAASVRRSASTVALLRQNAALDSDDDDDDDDDIVTNEDDDDDDDDGGADDEDDDDEDDEDDAHDRVAVAARSNFGSAAVASTAGASSAQRAAMRSSAPHPALEMDFDFGDFGAFKHASAFEVPASDLFGFGHDDHMSGLLQGDEVTAVGTHTDYVELLRGDSGQNVTSGLFQADDDELLEDDGAFGHHAVNIPPV